MNLYLKVLKKIKNENKNKIKNKINSVKTIKFKNLKKSICLQPVEYPEQYTYTEFTCQLCFNLILIL